MQRRCANALEGFLKQCGAPLFTIDPQSGAASEQPLDENTSSAANTPALTATQSTLFKQGDKAAQLPQTETLVDGANVTHT